jgi:tRNA-specific 2-thiouridylase
MAKKVYVGLSGGVDSSVTAALLKEQGYDVTGVYMKNWSEDIPGFPCPWKEDYQDAKRVAVQLDIPFKMFDFQTEYRHFVVDYMVQEYQAGRTPNPDVMCNQEVKFKLFLNSALDDGADMIATGHYARTKNGRLHTARNAAKDQTYFLYRVSSEALSKTLFPIGDFKTKAEVRMLARNFGLVTASKKDSQGICFVGKVGIKEFLLHELGPQKPGNIIDESGNVVGKHDGAIFYTIGQRHGLHIGGGLPYYVSGKNMKTNSLYVTTDLNDKKLWKSVLKLTDIHFIYKQQSFATENISVRIRYGAPLVKAKIDKKPRSLLVSLEDAVRAATPGQSVVFYQGPLVLGGGIII